MSCTELFAIWQFPRSAIKDPNVFVGSDTKTYCPWKGEAEYYSVKNGGQYSHLVVCLFTFFL